MALQIDMNSVLGFGAKVQTFLNFGSGERYHVSRVCVRTNIFSCLHQYPTSHHIPLSMLQLRHRQAWQEGLDWQADPDDEVEDWQVHRNLQRIAALVMSRFEDSWLRYSPNPSLATTALTASAQLPTVGTLPQGRALSSFRRQSFRAVTRQVRYASVPSVPKNYRAFTSQLLVDKFPLDLVDQLISLSPLLEYVPIKDMTIVVTQLQFDVVDLLSWVAPPPCRPGKRRRGLLDPIFLPPSPRPIQEDSSERPGPAQSPFRGVRYRRDHKRWVAEMRQGHNKVWMGDFHSEAQASRAIDAAHYYYGKTERLNFADAPQLLSARPKPAAALTETEMRKFVKEEGKWLASMAPARPCPSSLSARATLDIVESSVGRLAATFELRSFSEVANDSGDHDDVGDAVSQLQDSNMMPESGANGIRTMDHDMGAAMVSPVLQDSPAASGIGTMDRMSYDFQMLQDFLLRSPLPATVLQMDDRLDWHGNVEDLLEQETDEICRLIEL